MGSEEQPALQSLAAAAPLLHARWEERVRYFRTKTRAAIDDPLRMDIERGLPKLKGTWAGVLVTYGAISFTAEPFELKIDAKGAHIGQQRWDCRRMGHAVTLQGADAKGDVHDLQLFSLPNELVGMWRAGGRVGEAYLVRTSAARYERARFSNVSEIVAILVIAVAAAGGLWAIAPLSWVHVCLVVGAGGYILQDARQRRAFHLETWTMLGRIVRQRDLAAAARTAGLIRD